MAVKKSFCFFRAGGAAAEKVLPTQRFESGGEIGGGEVSSSLDDANSVG